MLINEKSEKSFKEINVFEESLIKIETEESSQRVKMICRILEQKFDEVQ